jgi:hypothetical protein
LKRRLSLLIATCVLPTCASAQYNYYFDLQTPAQAIAGQQVNIAVQSGYDTTSPPDGFISVNGNASGQLQFGNGGSGNFDLPLTSFAGGTVVNSASFQTLYKIPGVYSVSGNLRFVQQAFFQGNESSGSNDVFALANSISVIKDPVEVAKHQRAAADAQLSLNTLSLFNYLSSFGTAFSPVIGNIVGSVVSEVNPRVGPLLSTLIGLGVGFAGGPATAAVATAYALTNTYYQVKLAVETKLANDPPDPNYNQVYDPFGDIPVVTSGYGAAFDAFLNTGLQEITAIIGSEKAQLTALERGEAALADGDLDALTMQGDALTTYQAAEQNSLLGTAAWFESINGFLNANGSQTLVNVDELSSVYNETGQQLRLQIPEPSTWVLMILGFGATIVMTYRRQRAAPRRCEATSPPAQGPLGRRGAGAD